jgi:hypothetical protein
LALGGFAVGVLIYVVFWMNHLVPGFWCLVLGYVLQILGGLASGNFISHGGTLENGKKLQEST